MKRSGAHPQQGKLGEMDIERARLRLRKDGGGVAGFDRAALKDLAECVDPFRLDAIREHDLSPLPTLHQTSGKPRSRNDLNASSAPLRISPNSEIVIRGTNMSTA